MIDWWKVGANAVWIMGLAVLWASYSYRRFMAAHLRESYLQHSNRASSEFFSRLGILLVCGGFYATSRSAFERRLWAALFLITVIEYISCVFRSRRGRGTKQHTSTGGEASPGDED